MKYVVALAVAVVGLTIAVTLMTLTNADADADIGGGFLLLILVALGSPWSWLAIQTNAFVGVWQPLIAGLLAAVNVALVYIVTRFVGRRRRENHPLG